MSAPQGSAVILHLHDLCGFVVTAVTVHCYMTQSAYHAGKTCTAQKRTSVASTQTWEKQHLVRSQIPAFPVFAS
jgi:hypothetical protein